MEQGYAAIRQLRRQPIGARLLSAQQLLKACLEERARLRSSDQCRPAEREVFPGGTDLGAFGLDVLRDGADAGWAKAERS